MFIRLKNSPRHGQREPQLEGAKGRDVDAEGAIGLHLRNVKPGYWLMNYGNYG